MNTNISWIIPELAAFQEEPAQLPSGSPGKIPFLHLGFEKRRGRTELINVSRRAPLLVQRALYWDQEMPDMPCVFIMSSSGGILQGDRCAIEISLSPGSRAHVTTQAATKIQEMDTNYATQTQNIVLCENAYLEYLPDLIIPFKNSRFVSHTRLSIDMTATLLYSEIMMPGRKYYGNGELFLYEVFSSTVCLERAEGMPVFTEKFIIKPKLDRVRLTGIMGTFDVFANVLLITPEEHASRIFERTPSVVNQESGWAAGVNVLPNKSGLVYKVMGMESQPVKSKVRDFWKLVRKEVIGADVPDEFVWR